MKVLIILLSTALGPFYALALANLGIFNTDNNNANKHIFGVISKYYDSKPELSAGSCIFESRDVITLNYCEMDLYSGESMIIQCEQFPDYTSELLLKKGTVEPYKGYNKETMGKLGEVKLNSYLKSIEPQFKLSAVKKYNYSAKLLQWTLNGENSKNDYELLFACGTYRRQDKADRIINGLIKVRLLPSFEYINPTYHINIDDILSYSDDPLKKYYKHLTYGQNLKLTLNKEYQIAHLNTETIKKLKFDFLSLNVIIDQISLDKFKGDTGNFHRFVKLSNENKVINIDLTNPNNIFKSDETNPFHVIVVHEKRVHRYADAKVLIIFLYGPTYYSTIKTCGNVEDNSPSELSPYEKANNICHIKTSEKQTIGLHCKPPNGNHIPENMDIWKDMAGNDVELKNLVNIISHKRISPFYTILKFEPHQNNALNPSNQYDFGIYDKYYKFVCKVPSKDYEEESAESNFKFYTFILEHENKNQYKDKLDFVYDEIVLYPGKFKVTCPVVDRTQTHVHPKENSKIFVKDDSSKDFKLKSEDIQKVSEGLKRESDDISTILIYSQVKKQNIVYLTCQFPEGKTKKDLAIYRIILMEKPLVKWNGALELDKIKKLDKGEIGYWSLPRLDDFDLGIDCSKFFKSTEDTSISIYPKQWNKAITEKPVKGWDPEKAVLSDFGHTFLTNGLFIGKNTQHPNILSAYLNEFGAVISRYTVPFYYVCVAKSESENTTSMAVFEWMTPSINKRIKGCGVTFDYFVDDYGREQKVKHCSFNTTYRDLFKDPIAFHCPVFDSKKTPIKCYNRSNFISNLLRTNEEVSVFELPAYRSEIRSLWYLVKEKLKINKDGVTSVDCMCYDEKDNVIASISIKNSAFFNGISVALLLFSLFINV